MAIDVGLGLTDQIAHAPGDVSFAEQEEPDGGGQRVFVRPAKVNFRRAPTRESSKATVAMTWATEAQSLHAENQSAILFVDLHQRAVLELARIAQRRFDENDRHFVSQSMTLADARLFNVQTTPARPVRNEHRKLEMLERIPKKLRMQISEFERLECSSELRCKRDQNDDKTMAMMNQLAILMPSGRSIMLAAVV